MQLEDRKGRVGVTFKNVNSSHPINVQDDGGDRSPLWTCASKYGPDMRRQFIDRWRYKSQYQSSEAPPRSLLGRCGWIRWRWRGPGAALTGIGSRASTAERNTPPLMIRDGVPPPYGRLNMPRPRLHGLNMPRPRGGWGLGMFCQ